jgi:integrase
MKKDWYRLEFNSLEYVKNEKIKVLEKIISTLFQDPRFWDDVMILTPKDVDFREAMVWIFPPKTVNLMLEKLLINCGAEKCSQPNIDEVSVYIGNHQNIHDFFSN